MHARVPLLVVAVIALALPSLGSAQQSALSSSTPAAGPTIESSATAFRVSHASSDSASTMLQRRQNVGQPVALMIVGGVAILVGAVIGDAPGVLFMVGGAIALLYGLYQYLQ
jgi:hypothetical protein